VAPTDSIITIITGEINQGEIIRATTTATTTTPSFDADAGASANAAVGGTIAGTVLAVLAVLLIFVMLGILWLRRKNKKEHDGPTYEASIGKERGDTVDNPMWTQPTVPGFGAAPPGVDVVYKNEVSNAQESHDYAESNDLDSNDYAEVDNCRPSVVEADSTHYEADSTNYEDPNPNPNYEYDANVANPLDADRTLANETYSVPQDMPFESDDSCLPIDGTVCESNVDDHTVTKRRGTDFTPQDV